LHWQKPVPTTHLAGSSPAMRWLFQYLGTFSSTKYEMNQQHFVFYGPPAETFAQLLDPAWAGIRGCQPATPRRR